MAFKMNSSAAQRFEDELERINSRIRQEQARFISRPLNKVCNLDISHSLTSDVKSLGEIFEKCKEWPGDAVFIVLFYYIDQKRFWCPDELIIRIVAHKDERELCAYSEYYDEIPKNQIINNNSFINMCDPEKTGNLDCIGDRDPLWIIDNNTPIHIRTKKYYDLPINDVIHFDDKGTNYIGFVVNGKYY